MQSLYSQGRHGASAPNTSFLGNIGETLDDSPENCENLDRDTGVHTPEVFNRTAFETMSMEVRVDLETAAGRLQVDRHATAHSDRFRAATVFASLSRWLGSFRAAASATPCI